MNLINNEFNAQKTAGTCLKPQDLQVRYGIHGFGVGKADPRYTRAKPY